MCLLTDTMSSSLDPNELKTAKNLTKSGKPKSPRYTDRRREKSKIAARCRRGKESEIFQDLADTLPLPDSLRDSLDKASVVRLALCDLKLRNMFENGSILGSKLIPTATPENEFDSLACNAMGSGFVVIISNIGDIIYTSENISVALGLTQHDVMGKSIYEFCHPCDEPDVKELLGIGKSQPADSGVVRSTLIRLKCTLTSNGGCVHIRAATDKVIYFTGQIQSDPAVKDQTYFIGIGSSIPHPSDPDIPIKDQSFVTTHSPDMKVTSVDSSLQAYVGYNSDNLIGKSLFELQHAADPRSIGTALRSLYTKGQTQTEQYRFLVKNGGWVWMITQATAIKIRNETKLSSIVCRHYVLSEVQNPDELVSELQIIDSAEENAAEIYAPIEEPKTPLPQILSEVAGVTKPVPSTTKIFAPRTEDMDSGFLMPADYDESLTKLESIEEVDLTHLAPIAGDECIQLNNDLFEDLLKFFSSGNPNSSTFDGAIIDIDDLTALNSSNENSISFIPLDEFNDICFPEVSMPSPLILESDPVLASTVDITPAEAITLTGGTCDKATGKCSEIQQQQSLQNQVNDNDNYFDSSTDGLELLMNLPDELLTADTGFDLNSFDQFQQKKPDKGPCSNSRNTGQLPCKPDMRSLFNQVESIFLKRRAMGDLPTVVTKSIMGFTNDSIPPNKVPRYTSPAISLPQHSSPSSSTASTSIPSAELWNRLSIPGK